MGGADARELPEDVELERGDLGHGFDDEVDVRQVGEGGGWREEGPGGVGFLLGEARLGDALS